MIDLIAKILKIIGNTLIALKWPFGVDVLNFVHVRYPGIISPFAGVIIKATAAYA